MYNSIYELPSQVRSSLDEKDQKVWMDKYNECDPKTNSAVKKAKKTAWKACKDLPSSFSFRIKASMDVVDKDREIIDLESIKKHMDSFMDYGGNVQWEHGNYNVGTIWDWSPVKENGINGIEVWGNIFGGDGVYDQMRENFVKGKNSLSVAGEADRGKFQCDSRGCYTRRDVKQLLEISLCAVPANKYCTMEWYNDKAKLTKSDHHKDMTFGVSEYEIHKDYTKCPLLGLKKSLQDIGFEAHAREDGVHVPMDLETFEKSYPHMIQNGIWGKYSDGEAIMMDRDQVIEKVFKEGYSRGYITDTGMITRRISQDSFNKMAKMNILHEKKGRLYLDCPEDVYV